MFWTSGERVFDSRSPHVTHTCNEPDSWRHQSTVLEEKECIVEYWVIILNIPPTLFRRVYKAILIAWFTVCLQTETKVTKVTSAIFHLAYIAKLISQGQVLATANGNAWSFFPVMSREILPCNSWFFLAGQRIPKWKKKTTWNDDSYLSLWNMSNNSLEDLGNFAKIYPKEKRRKAGRGSAILCNASPPVWYAAIVARVKSVKEA